MEQRHQKHMFLMTNERETFWHQWEWLTDNANNLKKKTENTKHHNLLENLHKSSLAEV